MAESSCEIRQQAVVGIGNDIKTIITFQVPNSTCDHSCYRGRNKNLSDYRSVTITLPTLNDATGSFSIPVS
jgi:hypothetical protein